MSCGLLRYLLGSLGIALVLAALARWLDAQGWTHAASCRIAVAVALLADLLAYWLTARGVGRGNRSFVALWGVAVVSKIGCLVAASVALVVAERVMRDEYLIALAAAFFVFTTRQAVALVKLLSPPAQSPAPVE